MFRVTSADEGKGLAELVSRPAEAVRWSMATYGWSQALGFSEANVTGAASSFLVGQDLIHCLLAGRKSEPVRLETET